MQDHYGVDADALGENDSIACSAHKTLSRWCICPNNVDYVKEFELAFLESTTTVIAVSTQVVNKI